MVASHVVVNIVLLAAWGGLVCASTPSDAVDGNHDESTFFTDKDQFQRFEKNYALARTLSVVDLAYVDEDTITLCCRRFQYTIFNRYRTPTELVYDGRIEDVATRKKIVVKDKYSASFAMQALRKAMKQYMTSLGIMHAKPCFLDYSYPTVSTVECASGKEIDCDDQCHFTCGTLFVSSICCDGGTMTPQIPICQKDDGNQNDAIIMKPTVISTSTQRNSAVISTSTQRNSADTLESENASRKIVIGTMEIGTTTNKPIQDESDRGSDVSTPETSATATDESPHEHAEQGMQGSRYKQYGYFALSVLFIIPVVYLIRNKLIQRKGTRLLLDTDEFQNDEYEDVEPDDNGSYQHRFIRPANPTHAQLDQEKNYPMSVQEKGLVYIMNNGKFWSRSLDRKGSEIDAQNARHIFEQIGYKPVICKNLTAQEIRKSLEDLKKMIKPCHPSIVLMLMSHGDEKGILGVDGNHVTLADIIDIFSGERCRDLIGKPKIIFVQACRGDKDMRNVLETKSEVQPEVSHRPDDSIAHDGDVRDLANDPESKSTNMIESDSPEANFAHYYIAQSTTHGFRSLRSRKSGSFFIQALCEEFLKRAHEESLDAIMNMVSRRVQSEERLFRWKDRTVHAIQVPQIVKQGIVKDILLLPKYP